MSLAAINFRSADQLPVAIAMLAIAGAALLAIYPGQLRQRRSPWQWLLPALRGAALAALGLSILKPVLSRTRTVEEQGAVIVLLDNSLSMGVRDRELGETPQERENTLPPLMALAESLGRLPPDLRGQGLAAVGESLRRLESLAEDVMRVRREVDYARLSGRHTADAQSRLEQAITEFLGSARSAEQSARSAKMPNVVIEQLSRLARPPRAERRDEWIRNLRASVVRARQPAEKAQAAIDEQLYQSDAESRRICDELALQSRLELAWDALSRGRRSLLSVLDSRIPVMGFAMSEDVSALPLARSNNPWAEAPVQPVGCTSDLAGSLRRVLQRVGRQAVQGVVVFSDGRHVGGQASLPAGLVPSGVPVFTVFAASPQVRDLAIDRVDLPSSVFAGEMLRVRVAGHCTNIDPAKLSGVARLSIEGGPTVTTPIPLSPGEKRIEPFEMRIPLDNPGLQKVTITLPPQEREATMANNQVERWVKVLSQKLKVLVLAGSPGWDYRYIRNALERTPYIELRDALVAPGLSRLGMTRQQILQQDLVILSDMAVDALTIEQWDAIRELVAQRGGSAIVIPGLSHLQDYTGYVVESFMPYPPAARPGWRIWPGENPHYRVAPATAGASLSIARLDNEPNTARRWDELPGFYRYLYMPQLKPSARALLEERESHSPILTEAHLGRGRVFFMAMSETWRWRSAGEGLQDRFWIQLVRYASDDPYALTRGRLSIDLDRVVAEPDQTFKVRARVHSRIADPPPPAALQMQILQEDRVVRAGVLSPSGSSIEGRYSGTISGLPVGEYRLMVTMRDEDETVTSLSLPLRVARNPELEMRDIAGNRDFLQQRLSEPTGGKCLNLEEVSELPQLLEQARLRQPRISELPLWDSGYLYLFVVGCLTIEWTMRKRFGLA